MTSKYRVSIAGESWDLVPPAGLVAMRKMPKVLSYVSKLIYVAIQSGFPVNEYISGERDSIDLGDAMKAIKFVADALGENFKEFEEEVVPFLLQRDYKWLSTHGTLMEIAGALWTSIRMLFSITGQDDVESALKKSEEAGAEPEQKMDLEIQEQ